MVRTVLLVGAALAGGCGFSVSGSGVGGDDGAGDDGGDDAPRLDAQTDGIAPDSPGPLPDAAPDVMPDMRIPVWTVVDTLTVPCTGDAVTSTVILAAAEMYTLRARGECVTNTFAFPDSRGDAEFAGYNIDTAVDVSEGVDVGLGINHNGTSASKTPNDWGNLAANHTYEVMFSGLGSTITARYRDPDFDNNASVPVDAERLRLEILRLQ